MKGEYDDQLQWPFRGKIIIRLVNQTDDDDYRETTLHFTEKISNYDDIASRMLTKKEEGKKRGLTDLNFICHADLKQKYLKNVCLILRVYMHKRRFVP